MLDNLSGADPTKYIRSYWNSAHGLTNERALYRKISQQIHTPKAAKELLKNLETYSMIYHDVMFPDEVSWYEDKELIFHLKNLKTLGASTFYPVVIAMESRDFDEADIAIVLKDIEMLYFRNNTICKNSSNAMERFFAQLAQDITEESLNKKKRYARRLENKQLKIVYLRKRLIFGQASKKKLYVIFYI